MQVVVVKGALKSGIRFFGSTVNIGFRNHPPSEGSRFLNPARPLNQGSGYSNQVVTGRAKRVLFLFPLGLATTTAAILLYKSQILRFLNPRLLFMYWRGSVKGVAVSKPSAAALSKVSKPNVDCTENPYLAQNLSTDPLEDRLRQRFSRRLT